MTPPGTATAPGSAPVASPGTAPGASPASATGAALSLRAVECVRGQRRLFADVDVAVAAGQLLRVQGANGAGKTSLLRMICGLSAPASGEIRWMGRPVNKPREEFNQQLVYLGHAPALKDDLSALENLQAASGLAGLPCPEPLALAALREAGLQGRERLPARVLSQGQRKRAGLARLLIHHAPGLWVLDEPFNALDEPACAWLQRVIDGQLSRGGVVVLTNHQPRAWDDTPPQVALVLSAPAAATAQATIAG